MSYRLCQGCDCTDNRACLDPETGIRAETERRHSEGLCTYCGDPLDEYDRFETACSGCREEQMAADENNAPLVELATDADANRVIAGLRRGGLA